MALSQRRARLIGRLRSRRTRAREGLVLVEGVRAAREALDAGAVVLFALVSPRLEDAPTGSALRARLEGVEIADVADGELAELSDTRSPQGVLLVCREPEASLAGLAGRRYLVLDAVQDPGNVGTLVRAVVAFGLDGIVCLDGTVDPWSPKAVRASAGSVFRRPPVLAREEEVAEWLQRRGVPILVADASGEDVERHRGAASFALIVGNEGEGVRDALKDRADAVVAVPMSGPAESLNAGVAGSILMHTLSRSAT